MYSESRSWLTRQGDRPDAMCTVQESDESESSTTVPMYTLYSTVQGGPGPGKKEVLMFSVWRNI